MICKDMKYTALYWALRFVENELDVHEKSYNGYKVIIYADEQYVDFGDKIKNGRHYELKTHKSFVVLECVDRLLSSDMQPEQIILDGRERQPDIIADGKEYYCEQWGKDFESAKKSFDKDGLLYTSRLVSGLLEWQTNETFFETVQGDPAMDIRNDELVSYHGGEKKVVVPEGIKTIGASAFWNNTFVEEVVLPESLEQLGGDCFYCCYNLKKVNIPKNVKVMGNNPFAGCPLLTIENHSPYFELIDGVLYNGDMTNLIHYTISKPQTEFTIPDGVICIGKHTFFMCDKLQKIVIPQSVIRMENNPFSGCTQLEIENHSPHYHFENGIIYNKFRTTIVGCLNGAKIEKFVVPETVTLISRNSFWNCKGVKEIIVTKNIDRIGYNPFAGCENLLLKSESPLFVAENGIIFDSNKTHLLCATDRAVGKTYRVPDSVTHINRGVFSGCKSLEKIDFNKVTYIDKSSFTNCTNLKEVFIPHTVKYIGEWAFAHCTNLQKISIKRGTVVDKNAFNECPVTIEWRG